MNVRVVGLALLNGALALVSPLCLYLLWPAVPARVGTHLSGGGLDHFAPRSVLWEWGWAPLLAWGLLTFWPQVHDGESPFWSSPLQRRVRAVLVGALVAGVLAVTCRNVRDAHPPGCPKDGPCPGPGRSEVVQLGRTV